jgi:hypothetical protein
MPEAQVPGWRRIREPVGVFLLCVVVYHLNGRPHTEVDCIAAPYVAWSLVRHASLDLTDYGDLNAYRGTELHPAASARWVSYRPIGSALAAVPFVAPFALRAMPPSMATMTHLGKLTAAVWVAGSVVLFFLLCRRLAPRAAPLATILYAFGTCMWSVASQALWMHGPATFWLCAALLLLLPSPEGPPLTFRSAVLAGLCLGLAVLTRPSSAFFPLATGVLWLLHRRWRLLLGLILGGAGPLALHLAVNHTLYGNAFLGGYHSDQWQMQPPIWLSFSGLLIAPSRGLFVYSPALLLAPIGFLAVRRDTPTRAMLTAWAGGAVLTVAFYAHWNEWRGGWCFGPRFLCEVLPVLGLLFALAYETMTGAWARRAAVLLVVLSVAVHLSGVFGYRVYAEWQLRHSNDSAGRVLFELRDTQIEAHARSVLCQLFPRLR